MIISLQITTGTLPGASRQVEQRAVHPSSLTRVSVQSRGSAVSSQLLLWYPGSRPGLKVFAGARQARNYPESHLVPLYSGATLKFLGDSNEIPRHSSGSGNVVTGTLTTTWMSCSFSLSCQFLRVTPASAPLLKSPPSCFSSSANPDLSQASKNTPLLKCAMRRYAHCLDLGATSQAEAGICMVWGSTEA